MSPPTVSVVLPVYNADQYLSTAVESILDQTYTDFELIALDDGSTDRSPEILRRYAETDDRVRVIHRPQPTLGALLNEGLREARGRYVARMDADDISRPRRLERQVDYLNAHPGVGIVGAQAQAISPEGYPIRRLDHPLTHDAIDAALLNGDGAALSHPVIMMRTDVAGQVGGYPSDRETSEDVDLYLRAAEQSRLANLSSVLLDYRLRPDSICHTRYGQQAIDTRAIVRAALRRRGADDRTPPTMDLSQQKHYQDPVHLRLLWARRALRAGHVRSAFYQLKVAFRHRPSFVVDGSLLRRILS
jgi:glycosyltransferase involved in cell wall biosynthesis